MFEPQTIKKFARIPRVIIIIFESFIAVHVMLFMFKLILNETSKQQVMLAKNESAWMKNDKENK